MCVGKEGVGACVGEERKEVCVGEEVVHCTGVCGGVGFNSHGTVSVLIRKSALLSTTVTAASGPPGASAEDSAHP